MDGLTLLVGCLEFATHHEEFTKEREGNSKAFPNFVFSVWFVVKNNERASTSCVE